MAVLFGGGGGENVLDDTWTWDGSAWTQLTVTGPSARAGASLASAFGTAVLFGGEVPTIAETAPPSAGVPVVDDDMWLWNGQSWTETQTTVPPAASSCGAMAASGSFLVLFGGVGTAPDGGTADGDTWIWSGTAWTQKAPAGPVPPARQQASMVTWNGQALLFGGEDNSSISLYGDLWSWNGTSWTEYPTPTGFDAAPSPRSSAAMAVVNGLVVVFGGYAFQDDANVIVGDTWTWDGTSWSFVAQPGPSARDFAVAASVGGKMVLFGGEDENGNILGDTWTFDGTTWTQEMVTGPSARAGASMTAM